MSKKPTQMSSEELWHFVRTGTIAEPWQIAQMKNTLDVVARKEQAVKLYEQIGKCVGVSVVLCIYGAFFWFFSKAFYPLSIMQSIVASICFFLIGKILTMPTIMYWNTKDPNGGV